MLPHRRPQETPSRPERASRRRDDDSQITRVPLGDEASRPVSVELEAREHDVTEKTPLPARLSRRFDDDDQTEVRLPLSDAQPEPEPEPEPEIEIEIAEDVQISPMRGSAARARRPVTELPPDATRPEINLPKHVAAPEPAPRRPDRPDRDDRTLVRRIVDSVVAALPSAVKKAVDRSLPISTHKIGANAAIDTRAWRELRTAPIFDGLPNEALRDALLGGDASVLRLGRDALVPLDGRVALVRSGQVALGQFSDEVLRAERKAAAAVAGKPDKSAAKKEKKRRTQVGPLIRLAEQNLATFEEGDVVESSVAATQHTTLACYSVTPVSVVTLSRDRVDLWKRIYPFMADRFRRAAAHARAKLDAVTQGGGKAAVADFFIRHGLSVSLTLRVRKLDSCIECGACEQACEDRYGVKRLSLNGRILGGLDFVDACHTCTDQRCIDPCNFDAISFDAERREVLINEANCTGCTLCAAACPYDAIEMHELDEAPLLKLRLDKAGLLAFGEGAPRKAKLRRMASKCDHCAFFEDQACISACPTGALIEILPSDAVAQLPEQARAVAKAGFDRTAAIDVRNVNQTKAFTKGLELPELGRARGRRAKVVVGLWWAVGLFAFFAVAAEILLRKLWPARSAAFFFATVIDGIDPEMALGRVDYRPGCELAVRLGYVGTAILLSSMAYVWRRRFSFMRNWGSLRAWFDWHVLSGVIGPLFILLHTAAKLDNWVSMAFWSMILTVASGLLGRYLTTQLPERASTAAVETLEVSSALEELRRLHVGVRAADAWFEHYRTRVQKFERRFKNGAPTFFGAVLTCAWVLWDDLLRGHRMRQLARVLELSLRGYGARRVRRKARRYAYRLALLERRRVLLPRLEPLFSRWKAVHVPMAICMTLIATVHIALALLAG